MVIWDLNSRLKANPLYSADRFLATEIRIRSRFCVTKTKQDNSRFGSLTEVIKNCLMVFLTVGFVVLYGLALLGKLRPLADSSMVTRLEPIIFVLIGYYFGRLPGQQNEQTLKEEIGRQTQRADAAQHAKESALQTREVLDEKIKNARTALAADPLTAANGSAKALDNVNTERRSVETALGILSS